MKKIRIVIVAAIITTLLFFIVKGILDMLWYGPIYDIKTFNIFYGKPNQQKLESLATYDALIIEPMAFTEEDLTPLEKAEVKVFGYVSLMQLENWNEELKEHISSSDYATINGEQIYIKKWDTYIMDLREEQYRDALLWKIKTYIVDRKLDGIFFDTVDDLDYYFHEHTDIQNGMREGYLSLLEEIKTNFPELLIIQNRGFDTLKLTSHSYVDGLLWEGFHADDLKESDWAKNWLKYLKKEQWLGRTRVWTVVSDNESLELSRKHRFPAYMRIGDTYQD